MERSKARLDSRTSPFDHRVAVGGRNGSKRQDDGAAAHIGWRPRQNDSEGRRHAPAALNRLRAELLKAADSVGMNDLPGANPADVRASARQTIEETFSLIRASPSTATKTGQG